MGDFDDVQLLHLSLEPMELFETFIDAPDVLELGLRLGPVLVTDTLGVQFHAVDSKRNKSNFESGV